MSAHTHVGASAPEPPEPPVDPVAPVKPAPHTWTGKLRERFFGTFPPEKLMPEEQPEYVGSWIYVAGVATIAALVIIIVSGLVLTLEGPQWWHFSSRGHFVNSVHLWSVELFFLFMVVHLWGKFWMAAWRGRRAATWITGAICFLASVGTAFTGYATQTNFDSQWIATQAKDGLNSVGIGAFFNVLNVGQMLLFHVALLPLVLGGLVVWHVLLIRKHGVVPPIDAVDVEALSPADLSSTAAKEQTS